MSYQLEREMHDRVSRFHDEAAARRSIPRGILRHRLATTLHKLADRIDERAMGNRFAGEGQRVVLQGRNQ